MRLIAEDAPPLMNAAGQVKTVEDFIQAHAAATGAVLVGSYTLEERAGNPGQTYYQAPGLVINSLGMPGPNMVVWREWVHQMALINDDLGEKPLWVSVAGFSPDEYLTLTEAAFEAGADMVELNLGCPNVWGDDGQKPIVSYSLDATAAVLEKVGVAFNLTTADIGVKLSPILDPTFMAAYDALLVEAGVAFVTTMNTVPNCYVEDASSHLPAIGNPPHLGGLSGPCIKPIAMGQVIQHRALMPDMPIVAAGGVVNGSDVDDFLALGAEVVQLGGYWATHGPRGVAEIIPGMRSPV